MRHAPTLLFALLFALLFFTPGGAAAQSAIRDAEIERDLQTWLAPLLKQAQLSEGQVDIIILQDPEPNAFVAGGANIFLNTGLLLMTDNPGEVAAVMAHELGHISGGHLVRGREAMESASYGSILGVLLGLGAAIGTGEAGAAAAIGTGGTSMAQRAMLRNMRGYEASADQFALAKMDEAGIDPSGMQSFLKKMAGQEALALDRQSAYVRTHPLSGDRLSAIAARVADSPAAGTGWPAEWDEQHARMKAKLLGFLHPERVAWEYDDRDRSVAADYARTIAAYRDNRVDEALAKADALIAREPGNPYFHELKGQMLLEFGRVAAAVPAYQKALALDPGAALIRIALAHAQIESAGRGDTAQLQSAIENLKTAATKEPRIPLIHRLMATAYGRMDDRPRARLHLAEEALLQGRKDEAAAGAKAAADALPPGDPDYVRAKDILRAAGA